MKAKLIMIVVIGVGLLWTAVGSGESRGTAVGDRLLSRIRGGDQYTRNLDREVCALANINFPPEQTAAQCETLGMGISGAPCIDCGKQPSLEMGTPSRLQNDPFICCCTVQRKVGQCWRDPPDFIYYCKGAEVDEDEPSCLGGLYWTNRAQH